MMPFDQKKTSHALLLVSCIVAVCVLGACQKRSTASKSGPQTLQSVPASSVSAPQHQEEKLHEIAGQIFAEKIRNNGANILCDQHQYRKCFKIKRQQCLQELRSYNEECISRGVEELKGLVTRDNVKRFGQVYSACLLSRHLSDHINQYYETTNCLRETRLNRQKALKSLLR